MSGAAAMPAVRRIGFAYNPTSDAAIELRERASAPLINGSSGCGQRQARRIFELSFHS